MKSMRTERKAAEQWEKKEEKQKRGGRVFIGGKKWVGAWFVCLLGRERESEQEEGAWVVVVGQGNNDRPRKESTGMA